MQTKFAESLGGKLAENWTANILTPAFVFWIGGLLAWVWRFGRKPLEYWLKQQPESLLIAVMVSGLLIIAVSAFVVQKLDLSILRFLEGYWSPCLFSLRRWMIRQKEYEFKQKDKRWQTLADRRDQQILTNEELEEYVTLDGQLMQFPSKPERLMPTKLGNIIRATESRPYDKYGLDAVICWPRLWLVLPNEVKKELQEARSNLNTAARFWFWS